MVVDPVIQQFLVQVGSDLTSEAVKAAVGRALAKGPATKQTIKDELEKVASIHGTTVHADELIDILAKNNFLHVTDSKFYASDSISFAAEEAGYRLENVDSRTDHTRINTGRGGSINVPPGGSVVQGPPGRPGDVEISSPGAIHFTF